MSKNIQIEFKIDDNKYDESNQLILDDKSNRKINAKQKEVKRKKQELRKQLLSKKKKKQLEKILERKNKKLNRTNLINDLKQYQINENEYECMPSTSIVQTIGKRKINDLLQLYSSINNNNNNNDNNNDGDKKTENDFKKYKIRRIKFKMNEKNFNRKDPHESDEHLKNDEKTAESNKSTVDKDEKIVKEKTKSRFVIVDRPDEIQRARQQLPILAEEHNIMDAINHNQVVIICGETGSGKTTQVPQFLYEAGYTMNDKLIGITEPRRVAAIAMSKRVAYELNMSENIVSYQIRFEGNVTDKTKIKFMTDGILMKELEKDLYLTKYSAIIIDEAHERSLYSDILIGFLSRIIQYRHNQDDPLKLIIMSATLRVEDFTENKHLFKIPPPVIKIDSRQYPVTIHFNKYTNENYIQEAYKKVCKIHTISPPGGILVFVTGRTEVKSLCRMLRSKFPITNNQINGKFNPKSKTKRQKSVENSETNENEASNDPVNTVKTRINLDVYSIDPVETKEIINENIELFDNDYNDTDNENIDDNDVDDGEKNLYDDQEDYDEQLGFLPTTEPLYCLPLYSMLSSKKQSLVFETPPAGCRLCVIATNIAETSLTIPNIRYVIDAGKVKNIVYDRLTSVSTFIIDWTSKASADQRSGRAGRTSAGHCYRLYSSAVFNDQFKQYSNPEILQKPIDDLLLQMKSIGFRNVINFPFPTKPNLESLMAAEKLLCHLDALEIVENVDKKINKNKSKQIEHTKITWFGKLMANFPISPRFSRMLILSTKANLVNLIVVLISVLTVQEFFIADASKAIKKRRENWFFSHPFCHILGDLWTLLSAFGSAHYHSFSEKFCFAHGLRLNAIREAEKLRLQLLNQLKLIMKNQSLTKELTVPNEIEVKMLSKLFLSGFSDHIAKRIPFITITEHDETSDEMRKVQKSIKNCYQSIEVDKYVFISPNSVLFNQNNDFVVYQELFESSESNNNKIYMRNVVPIQMEWLAIYGQKHCKFSNPLQEPPPRYDPNDDCVKCYRTSVFGIYGWELPAIEVEYPDCLEKYCHFAYFLFNGDVFTSLKSNLRFISTPPIIFLKSWSLIQTKVDQTIKCLMSNQICSKRSLTTKWKSNSKFLLKEYLEWINDEEQRQHIRKSWPPSD
uniref:Probable ATP-dependent RNA helicase DHX37 n=1 Tax=Psoroptes ovis TaxID=83912 RepID=A0A3B0R2G7_PSOOV|nr:probable ATP-dependent RNA helicase DHX37 [Psoroptes ovis]